jgi:hypothetical protein
MVDHPATLLLVFVLLLVPLDFPHNIFEHSLAVENDDARLLKVACICHHPSRIFLNHPNMLKVLLSDRIERRHFHLRLLNQLKKSVFLYRRGQLSDLLGFWFHIGFWGGKEL